MDENKKLSHTADLSFKAFAKRFITEVFHVDKGIFGTLIFYLNFSVNVIEQDYCQ